MARTERHGGNPMSTPASMPAALTLGSVLFNWEAERWRDFYFRIADEAPIETVHVGETVCSKRLPFFAPHLPDVVERLERAGKEVVFSTLALVMEEREVAALRDLDAVEGNLVEANDVAALTHVTGRPHVIGPFVNVYNEGTLDLLVKRGAVRICLPIEVPEKTLRVLGAEAAGCVELEAFAFGRMPLALSARCYHARHHGLTKDNCRFVCAKDPDGLTVETLDDQPFLAINGIQTMSHRYISLIQELDLLAECGVGRIRLSPHTCDMVAVAETFRAVLDGRLGGPEGQTELDRITGGVPFSNGFLHGAEGAAQVPRPESE